MLCAYGLDGCAKGHKEVYCFRQCPYIQFERIVLFARFVVGGYKRTRAGGDPKSPIGCARVCARARVCVKELRKTLIPLEGDLVDAITIRSGLLARP
jgi:hypothetical protein